MPVIRGAQGRERSRAQQPGAGGWLITAPTRSDLHPCGERLDVSRVCRRRDALGTSTDSEGRLRFGVILRGYAGGLPGATQGAT